MRLKILFIAIVLLTGLSIQQCTTGCLRCNNQNQCQLCDVTNNYRLVANTCQLNTLVSCLLANQDNTCARCVNGWYIDPNTRTCLQVASASVVANCITYSSSQVCLSCGPNFYLSLGACVAITTTVPFCRLYSADGVCSLCEPGYVRSGTDNACVSLPTGDNCLYYTFIKCVRCNPNYVQNNNLYFTNWVSNEHVITQYLHPLILRNQYWNRLQVCQLVTVKNCLEASAFNVCTKCQAGYYLQGGLCFIYPDPAILNCGTYSSLTVCTACKTGFYLDLNTCKANTNVANCLTHSTTALSVCTLCNTGYYVSNGACAARTVVNVQNCATYEIALDQCATCTGSLIRTGDGAKCLAAIPNCQTYETGTTSQSTSHSCSLCSNGYYKITSGSISTCTAGTVANCLTYAAAANTCTVCQNQYYLSGALCVRHVDIAQCKTYDATLQNICSACNSGYYALKHGQVCVTTTLIQNCKTYDNDGACSVCNDRFYLVAGKCDPISATLKNCLTTTDGASCTKCDFDNGWVLANVFTQTNCTQVPDYITNHCKVKAKYLAGVNDQVKITSTTSDNGEFCDACGDYQIPIALSRYWPVCVNPVDLKLYKGYNAVTNCKRYGLNAWNYPTGSTSVIGDNIVCNECISGYYLTGYADRGFYSTTGLACSQTCSVTSNLIVHDNYLGFVNLCLSQSTANTDAVGSPFFYVSSDSGCQKSAKFRHIKAGTIYTDATNFSTFVIADKEHHDFACYLAKPNSATATKKYYLAWNGDDDMYTASPYEGTLKTNPYPTGFFRPTMANTGFTKLTQAHWRDFGGAYSNTVDSSSAYPTVFNYLGVLPFFQVLDVYTATDALNFKGNNLNNCDIIFKYTNIATRRRMGYAFSTSFSTLYTAADITTGYKLTCLRCAFGYMLSYTASTAAANNPTFPSCVTNSACLSATTVMGGLPTYLNSLFSCHVCGNRNDNVRLYPSVWIEIDANNGGPAADGGSRNGAFVGWSIKDAYTSATAVDNRHGFKCAPAPDEVAYGSGATPTYGSILNCAAFGYITSLTTFTTVASTTGTASTVFASPTTSYNQVPICLACFANTFPEYGIRDSTLGITAAAADMTSNVWKDDVFVHANNLPTYYVKKCTQVANCDRSVATSYNTCSRCTQDDFAQGKYYAFIDFSLTKCVPVKTPNCLIAAGIDDVNSNNCQVCKSGYTLETDLCQKFRIPNMPNSALYDIVDEESVIKNWSNTQANLSTAFLYLSLLKYGRTSYFGPSECNKDYVQFPTLRHANRLCVWWEQAYNPPSTFDFGSSSYVIQNCKVYKYGQLVAGLAAHNAARPKRCHECVEGYIPNDDFRACVVKIANCAYGDNANAGQCKTCVSGYTPVSGTCVVNSIAHCNIFGESTGALVCTTCLPGFYYDSTAVKCLQGLVQNCKVYAANSATQCTTCMDNFTLIALSNSKYYCYPLPSTLNCAQLDSTTFIANPAVSSCNSGQCKSTATAAYKRADWIGTPPAATVARSVCLPFSLITNCKTYSETAALIVDNTFACTECVTGYWYSAANFTCAQRQNIPSQCTEFEKTQDLCKTCDATSYISSDKKKCVLFPTGVANCNSYTSATTCNGCSSGYYLSNNACILSTVITSCNVYSNENVCSACQTGFLLVNPTTCTQLTATNCLTATDLNTCATCSPGYGLKVDGTTTNCVDNLVLLSNCVTATQLFPFKCLLCSPAYYLNAAGECVAITRLIPYCSKYDTATTCEICVNGTVLNLTRTSCDKEKYASEVDGNCLESQLLANPTCTQCASGFYFSSGACVACSSNNYNSGCLSCDPNNNGACLVCRPTFYMNSQGACVSSSLIVNNPTGTTTPQSGFSMINKALTVTLTLATLYYDQL